MGHLAIVTTDEDTSCKVLYNKIIQPRLERGQYVELNEKYSGITWKQYNDGIPYDVAIDEVKGILKDAIVVGHDIMHDINALGLTKTEFSSLVYCICDTGKNTRLSDLVPSERGKKTSKLAALAHNLLGREIQTNTQHNPIEDAFATLQIFLQHRDLFEEAPCDLRDDIVTLTATGQKFRLA